MPDGEAINKYRRRQYILRTRYICPAGIYYILLNISVIPTHNIL